MDLILLSRQVHINVPRTLIRIITIYASMIYTAQCVILLIRAASITKSSGRALGPGNREFFGPCEMASSR
jgi:hypothetical protein